MVRYLTVLITNVAFAFRSGTEIVVDQVARGLGRRGHRPIVFAPYIGGGLVEGLRNNGIAVVDRLNQVGVVPDIIHGQHNVATVMAIAAFPKTRALFTCHDFDSPKDRAPLLPRIRRYIAVDESCRERLIRDGVPQNKIDIVLNAVDLDQYQRRGPLPPRPERALVLTKVGTHLPVVRSVARKAGLALDELGSGTGVVINDLPKRLPSYDVVFATARMAKEAIAAGCAVVVCDHRGLAGLATTSTLPDWRRHNFGRRLLSHAMTEDKLLQALARYDADDAAKVTDVIRDEDNLDAHIETLERIYAAILDDPEPIDLAADFESLAPFLEEFLISRNLSRSWVDLYRNITGEAVDVLEQVLCRHTVELKTSIAQGMEYLVSYGEPRPIDLASGRPHNDADVRFDEHLSFTTPREQWHYAVTFRHLDITGPSVIEIDASITEGAIGFGLVDPGLSQYITTERSVEAENTQGTIRIFVQEPNPDAILVIRNVAANGERSRGIIYGIRILARLSGRLHSNRHQ